MTQKEAFVGYYLSGSCYSIEVSYWENVLATEMAAYRVAVPCACKHSIEHSKVTESSLNDEEIRSVVKHHYNLSVEKISRLEGYENKNYKLWAQAETGVQSTYVFKVYPYSQNMADILAAENQVLTSLSTSPEFVKRKYALPRPVPCCDGAMQKVVAVRGDIIIRLLSFVEGDFLAKVQHNEALFTTFGEFLARLNLALSRITSYVHQARRSHWDIQYLHLNKKYISEIEVPENRRIVSYFFMKFDEEVAPLLDNLPKALIHNDANENNVLVRDAEVTSIIDFGDMTYSLRINELAVAIVYGCYDKAEPLSWAKIIVRAYHQVSSLTCDEVKVLYYLVAARLCISVCNSAHASRINPDNAYTTSSEKNAFGLLHTWLRINPKAARDSFLQAIGEKPSESIDTSSLVERRYKSLGRALSLSYNKPLHFRSAALQYMYDENGKAYLDAYNNIPHVGHCHPKVVAAGQRQMALLNTNTRYLYEALPRYAEKLLAHFPSRLSKVVFVNSGSAASDLALRMVRSFAAHKSGQRQAFVQSKLMVMEHGYHGNTQLAMDISDYKFSHPKGQGQRDYVVKTAMPKVYQGKYHIDDGSAGLAYANDAVAALGDEPVDAFIAEPIVGCGGQVPLAKGYLKALYPALRKRGALCISDEVQTGFARLGDCFWGFEAHEVVPDIVILGKPMANGHPMGAVVCTEEVAESFADGLEFFSSFGGNPVSCVIAEAVLDVIEEEGLQRKAWEVGAYYKSSLNALKDKYPALGDVRGSGLFLGVECVHPDTLRSDRELAHYIKNGLRDLQVLVSTDGPDDNVLKTKPPIIFNRKNVDEVVTKLEGLLQNYHSHQKSRS